MLSIRGLRRTASVSLGLALAACATAGGPRTGGGIGSDAEALAAIGRVSRDFSARYMRGDAAGMAAIYTDDAVIFPPGRPAIRGRPALEEYWRLAAGERIIDHRVTSDSVVLRGDIAYDYGTYVVRGERGGKPFGPTHGKYVIVWREVAPGDWRMHLDIWNGSPPP